MGLIRRSIMAVQPPVKGFSRGSSPLAGATVNHPFAGSIPALGAILLLLCLPAFGWASSKTTYGNVPAEIVRIYDGDTLTVNISKWPKVIGEKVGVRVYGIDTREMDAGGKVAKKRVEELIPVGSTVMLFNIRRDKYFRILADVGYNCDTIVKKRPVCKDLAATLIEEKYAVPYFGGTKEEFAEGIK